MRRLPASTATPGMAGMLWIWHPRMTSLVSGPCRMHAPYSIVIQTEAHVGLSTKSVAAIDRSIQCNAIRLKT